MNRREKFFRLPIGIIFFMALITAAGVNALNNPTTPLLLPNNVADTPMPTPEGEYELYTVRSGDTLGGIAYRFGTTVRAISQANQITNYDLIIAGDHLYIPLSVGSSANTSSIEETATPLPTPIAEPTDGTPVAEVTSEAIDVTAQIASEASLTPTPTLTPTPPPEPLQFGLEAFMTANSAVADTALAVSVNAQWVKLRVNWSAIEAIPSQFDYANLDAIIAAIEDRDLRILLTVASAPGWTRTIQEENGPPDDYSLFATFLTDLSTRYLGRIAAYEIWNEPNLRREWNSSVHPIGAASYTELLRSAYTAIKSVDASTSVISAGLAPTGIDDGFNAVNDRRFFTEFLALGGQNFVDGFGLHLYGFGNPPDFPCCDAPIGVDSHFGDISFYFTPMFNQYRDLAQTAATPRPFWITASGWGVAIPHEEVPRNVAYIAYNTLEEQAAFTLTALNIAQSSGIVRVMILSNLNGCLAEPISVEMCYTSIIAPDNAPRPVFDALRARISPP